jgi:hypothetical protein
VYPHQGLLLADPLQGDGGDIEGRYFCRVVITVLNFVEKVEALLDVVRMQA